MKQLSVNEARYIHGEYGKGTWTFYGGHDPEDYQHKVGDPPTDLNLHPNSPGYRLILNNILFPAAKKEKAENLMSDSSEIYFHVGTGKTGSTFLQTRIFPLLNEIYYIPTNRYHKIFQEIEKSSSTKILISREFDQQLEREVKCFSEKHPNTTPIIVFRRHDSYIASQYRRFVKNGFTGNFQAFFDLQNNEGYFKQSDLDYKSQVALLKKNSLKSLLFLITRTSRKMLKTLH